jgi:hypothetical protein
MNLMTDITYRRLFEGITMSTEQEASARALIAQTQQDVQALRPQFPALLRFNPATGLVTLREEGQSALEGLITNEADLAKFRSRLAPAPR